MDKSKLTISSFADQITRNDSRSRFQLLNEPECYWFFYWAEKSGLELATYSVWDWACNIALACSAFGSVFGSELAQYLVQNLNKYLAQHLAQYLAL